MIESVISIVKPKRKLERERKREEEIHMVPDMFQPSENNSNISYRSNIPNIQNKSSVKNISNVSSDISTSQNADKIGNTTRFPKSAFAVFMGYSDHNSDRFEGVQIKEDIADTSVKVNDIDNTNDLEYNINCESNYLHGLTDVNSINQCHLSDNFDSRTQYDVINSDGSALQEIKGSSMVNLMIDRFEAGGKIIKSVNVSDNNSKTKNRVGLKSPLLHIMQSNEKKFSANIKAKKEKDSIKKLKKREKEAKSDSERKRIKERAELQRLFDKIVAKKVVESGSKCAKIVASPDIGASRCLNFKNQPNDDVEDS